MRREPASRAETSGHRGEDLAARHLRDHGFAVLAQDLRTAHGEIDLLARRGGIVVAAEVKARRDHPAPERTVGVEQLQRLSRALLAVADQLQPRPQTLRIDVIAVRWRDPAAPELSHFPAVRSWRRGNGAPSAVSDWRPLAPTEYSCAADEVAWRRWCRRVVATGRAVVSALLRAPRPWREG